MKIILFCNGFVDPGNVFLETSKPKFLKNVIIVGREEYYRKKYEDRVDYIDYSELETEVKGSQWELEKDYMRQLRPTLSAALEKAGDLLFIATCEPAEMAALPVIQAICAKQNIKLHLFFIAPFLFQGKKQAENLRNMLNDVTDSYTSISLYYADELLNRKKNDENIDEAGPLPEIKTTQDAFDALEHNAAAIAKDMCRQIPRLYRGIQYTYNFNENQFSLAINPVQIILKMWYGVVNDKELFEKDFKEDFENVTEKRPSAYKSLEANSIPFSAYKSQVSESTLSRITDRIKVMIHDDDGLEDPEMKKKAEERLRGEIQKFQVRQREAMVKYRGQQPTEIKEDVEALAEIHFSGVSAEPSSMPEEDSRPLMQTPYQRAARAAKHKEERNRWAPAVSIAKADAENYTVKEKNVNINAGEKEEPITETLVTEAAEVQSGADLPENVAEKELDDAVIQGSLKGKYEESEQEVVLPTDLDEIVSSSEELKKANAAHIASGRMDFTYKSEGFDFKADKARRRAEKQAEKMKKKLAKAEEKAAVAAAKAEAAAKQVERISREKEK